jgi:hypothetical protein
MAHLTRRHGDTPSSGFPDGSPPKKPRSKTSPSDLRREARRLAARIDEARTERREPWTEGGQSAFDAEVRERKLRKLHGKKRALRREVYAEVPELEGQDFRKRHPGRSR